MKDNMSEKDVLKLDDYLKEHNQGFSQIPKAIIRTKELNHTEYRLWTLLLSYQGEYGIFPGQKRLADDLGMRRETVSVNLKSLETKDFLESKKRGYSKTNEYTLKVPLKIREEYQNNLKEYEKRYKLSETRKAEILVISARLGSAFILNDNDLFILEKSENIKLQENEGNIIELMIALKNKDFKLNSKTNSLLKAMITYTKQFKKAPKTNEILSLDNLLSKHKESIVIEALKQAKKEKKKINDVLETAEKEVERKGYFASGNKPNTTSKQSIKTVDTFEGYDLDLLDE